MKKNILENLKEFERLIQGTQISSSFKISILSEVAKMTSIPHIHMMTADMMIQLLITTNFEKTEKVDGANWSCGMMNKKVYTKTKRGKPETNPQAHFKLRSLNWSIYDAFGRSIEMLNKNGFSQFYKQIEKEYKDRILKQFKPKKYLGIAIFGEIFGTNQSNALAYDADAIGKGALIIFGCKIDDGTPKGVSLSTDKIGYEIMNKFVQKFNGADGWKVYNKKPVGLEVNKTYVKAIKNFLKKHMDEIKSRKRDTKSLMLKVKAKQELERIVKNFKKTLLRQIGTMKSFLGDIEIEGVIIRNKDNGAIAKIVDVEKFTALNFKNWEGRKAVVEERKQLYKDMIEKVVKSADIFIIQSKIQQKIVDYLEYAGKTKFDNLDELLNVIYEDAADEVQLKSAKLMVKDVKELITSYHQSVAKVREDTIARQKKPETKIDDFNYSMTMKQLDREDEEMNTFVKNLESALKGGNAWARVVEFLIGNKAIEDLVKNYVK